ncbi:MAG TPA: hypothetical protein VND93_15790 [Myxococcales bacterium]|nr:hypothetical protein [Myxococcales bacterium]
MEGEADGGTPAGRGRVSANALLLAMVLGGGLALTLLVRWFWSSGDPTADLVLQLKSAEGEGALQLAIPGEAARLVSGRASFDRITLELTPGAPDAFATATLDLEGKLEETQVHSLGYERVRFTRDGRDWVPAEGLAPMLSRAMAALCARRRALDGGKVADLAGLSHRTPEQVRGDPEVARVLGLSERRYRVKGWYLRLERDSALVSEDSRLTGSSPERPVDEQRTRRLELKLDPQGEFYFASGLM